MTSDRYKIIKKILVTCAVLSGVVMIWIFTTSLTQKTEKAKTGLDMQDITQPKTGQVQAQIYDTAIRRPEPQKESNQTDTASSAMLITSDDPESPEALNTEPVTPVDTPVQESEEQQPVQEEETSAGNADIVEMLARLVYGEAGSCSAEQQAAVVWCVLNRVDAGYGDIYSTIIAPYQFVGYSPDNPVQEDIAYIVGDVLDRWEREKAGETDVGRVIPSDYLWFTGDGVVNYYRNTYDASNGYWDWSLPSPYEG